MDTDTTTNNTEDGAYRKASNNFSKGSKQVFGNIKSIAIVDDRPEGGEYHDLEQESILTSKPKTFIDGTLKGVYSIGSGIINGAKGIVEQPYRGAKKEGFLGFAKGMAKGVSGVVILPVVGVMEFVTLTTQGIINTPLTVLDAMKNAPKEEELTILATESKPIFFGTPLLESIEASKGKNIPHLIRVCLEYLNQNKSIEQQGIFRISGSKSLIDEIEKKFDTGQINSAQDLDPKWTYEVACIFKAYFRYLPESIIPEQQIKEFFHIQTNIIDPKQKALALKNVINSIPEPNYSIIYDCIAFYASVAKKSKLNLMTASNISIIVGPSWLRPSNDLQEVANANTIAYNLISFFQELFTRHPVSNNY
ncbi:hypothetical protein CYY_009350 [Polysphondylium violaceum]|uniref:Rho-GAP domain-containing protein n=1 Tax=Polysphondylium violaceum TaxID=133409 RepID=A0A8J4V316_9MYCE|nr:hypothetical protein CYY_009350 [Polysphondylium violaceum]